MTRHVIIYPRDYVLLIALGMMCGLVLMNWKDYGTCKDPLAVWLVVDFLSFIFFRLLQFTVQYFGSVGGPVYRRVASCLAVLNLYLVYPFIWAWVVVGTIWYSRSKDCLPESTSSWWFVAWLVYSYLYLIAFGALIVSFYRMRSMREGEQTNLQALLDEYLRAEAYGLEARRGMSAPDIESLPARTVTVAELERSASCAICMSDFKPGDAVREIRCAHLFHTPCLDQWLRANATCPCCRLDLAPVDESPEEGGLLGEGTYNSEARVGDGGGINDECGFPSCGCRKCGSGHRDGFEEAAAAAVSEAAAAGPGDVGNSRLMT